MLIESLDQNSNGWVEVDITEPYQLKPGQFVLCSTAEKVTLPDDIAGQLMLRSSATRKGFDHCLAGFVDSGWSGELTLELRNNLQLNFLEIQAGMRLVQPLLPPQLPRFLPLLQGRQLLRSGGRHTFKQQPSAHHEMPRMRL